MIETINRIAAHLPVQKETGIRTDKKSPFKKFSIVREHRRVRRKKGILRTFIALVGSQKRSYNRQFLICQARSLAEARAKIEDELGGLNFGKVEVRSVHKDDFLLMCNLKKREVCSIGEY